MVESRIGASLKAARTRAGWSREALAFHSGVSWSAIAQIESGRRKDIRSSSLTALADALGVSVDYLIGTAAAAAPPHLFEHRVLTYSSDDDFVAGSVPFLDEGIDAGDCLLAVTTEAKTALLRTELGERSTNVEFADWGPWYESPTSALDHYADYLKRTVSAGAIWIRIVAEAAWSARSDAEIAAWNRYESLVNVMFAASPVTIICTYDERAFPPDVITDAHCTHPEIVCGTSATASATYRVPGDLLLSADAGGARS